MPIRCAGPRRAARLGFTFNAAVEMSPTTFCCVVCGYVIYDQANPGSASWVNQFRIRKGYLLVSNNIYNMLYSLANPDVYLVYSTPGATIAVTGVGIYDNAGGGEWRAPVDFAACWSQQPPSKRIGVLRQSPIDGRYGFPVHEACWSLLEKACAPRPVPHERLFRVCASLPFPTMGSGLSWGDSHGGLLFVVGDCYPWEDRYVEVDHTLGPPTARCDPYHASGMLRLLQEEPELPPDPMPVWQPPDCFSDLPQEIMVLISTLLPTVDVLNARRASISFLPIFYSQQFWASRFGADAERPWFFEFQGRHQIRDWRWLYRRTNEAHRTGGMVNRERVWGLIQRLKGALSLQWDESRSSAIADVDVDVDVANNLTWRQVTGDLRPETDVGPLHSFDEGCRLFREQQASIPPGQLSHMAFSLTQLGDSVYIAGIRLILSRDQQDIQLGFRAEDELILPAALLSGFNVAMGSRGIQGLQCVFSNQTESQWVGCPDDAPRTRRLTLSSPITAIKVGTDGCKMVSLAVDECIPLPGRTSSLRDSAFWYPQVPPSGLYLNQDCFTASGTATTRYQPLCSAMFGGAQGIYLRSLTGVTVNSFGTVRAIEFHYNDDDVPVGCRKVGHCISGLHVTHFPIDGPGGEVIDSVTVYIKHPIIDTASIPWFYRQGRLDSFKLSTNYGRCCHFGAATEKPGVVEKPMTTAPGSTITGLYWSQHRNSITALGVVSETINRQEE